MTAASIRRRSPTSDRIADSLTLLALALVIATILLTVSTGDIPPSGGGAAIALVITFVATGYLLARRQPGNPIGWLLIGAGMSAAFTTATGAYTSLDYGLRGGSMPFGPFVVFGQITFWPLALLLGMAVVLFFPDGTLTRPWRRALWAYVVVCVLILITQAIPGVVFASLSEGDLHRLQEHTGGVPGGSLVALFASGLPVLAAAPFWLAWIIRQVSAFRRARGDVRQQYKWFTAGAAVCVLSLVTTTITESQSHPSALVSAVSVLGTYAVAIFFPLGLAVAILRYRLYDIDRIISRTLAYAIVTGLLIGVYAGLVTLASLLVHSSSAIAVAISTLVAAALFSPLRRRVQRVVDRRFNRARYDADRTVAAFSARLQDAVDLGAVSTDLLDVVQHVLEPSHTSIWIAGGKS